MGCKWCQIDLDWRNENGKNVPYEVTDPKYQKRHICPKDPRNSQASPNQGAATSTTTSSSPTSKPDPQKSDIVIVGNLSDQVKNQIAFIVKGIVQSDDFKEAVREGVRKGLREVFVIK